MQWYETTEASTDQCSLRRRRRRSYKEFHSEIYLVRCFTSQTYAVGTSGRAFTVRCPNPHFSSCSGCVGHMSEPAAAPMEAVSTPQPSSENPVVQQAPAQRPKRKASEIENSHTAESIPAAKSQTVATKPPLPKLKSDAEEMKREADPERPCFGEPAEGKVRFHAIRNDGGVRNMLWLLQLKQIFSRQLPKMPPQYITRLIFDPHHVSLGLFHGHEPIGGIAYRPFYEQECVASLVNYNEMVG